MCSIIIRSIAKQNCFNGEKVVDCDGWSCCCDGSCSGCSSSGGVILVMVAMIVNGTCFGSVVEDKLAVKLTTIV